MRADIDEAQHFLSLLAPNERIFTFQTFSDKKDALKGSDRLARTLHGRLVTHFGVLERLGERGAGIFVMVNRGDGKVHEGRRTCRTTDNVVAVRALFVDLDGAPLDPVDTCRMPPKIIVESSPGKYHCYWPQIGCPLEAFPDAQVALAKHFNGDPTVKDLPRVMRLPGFAHQKGTPFMTRMLKPARVS